MRRQKCCGGLLVVWGICLGLGVPLFYLGRSRAKSRALEEMRLSQLRLSIIPPQKRCWVFSHMNKAGGSTIKYMLQPWVDKKNISLGLFDSPQWQSGKKFADEFLAKEHTLTWGAYTEGLRPHGGKGCKWFTMFRHPIPRLVSAYYYCKRSPVDGLCASLVLRADETDLHTFAKHWGNFGLRQFAVGFVMPEDVIAAEVDDRCKLCPGWYRLKLYVEGLHAAKLAGSTNGTEGNDAEDLKSNASDNSAWQDIAMSNLLKPVKDILGNEYAAVGIMEEWETSLQLFNVALRIPNFDWPNTFREIGPKNYDHKFRVEEDKAALAARQDPDLKKLIALDLLLYDHALAVYARQLSEYGLG